MMKYDIPVWKMCYEAAKELSKTFRPIDVIRKIKERRPEVKENTIRAHVIALAPNHPSSKHHGIRHNLFYYLGNGNYRLLSEEEIVLPPTPLEEGIKVGTKFGRSLDTAEKMVNQGMYGPAIKEYGSVIEQLLRQLYQKYFPNMPIQYKEKILNYERERKKSINKFTIGEWIGLFRHVGLFKYVEQDKKVKSEFFIFFTPAILDTLNNLRNKSTHLTSDKDCYINRESALFVKSTITCILRELKE